LIRFDQIPFEDNFSTKTNMYILVNYVEEIQIEQNQSKTTGMANSFWNLTMLQEVICRPNF